MTTTTTTTLPTWNEAWGLCGCRSECKSVATFLSM